MTLVSVPLFAVIVLLTLSLFKSLRKDMATRQSAGSEARLTQRCATRRCAQSLSAVCRQLKSGALSSVELTRSMLERCQRVDAKLGSYARLMADSALAGSPACDLAQSQGDVLGALHGVPIAIKDLLFTKDAVTASGTEVMGNIFAQILTRL